MFKQMPYVLTMEAIKTLCLSLRIKDTAGQPGTMIQSYLEDLKVHFNSKKKEIIFVAIMI